VPAVRIANRLFVAGYVAVGVLFLVSAFTLVAFAVLELWEAVGPSASEAERTRLNAVLEAVGLLTIATAALELGQTILEEEVQREAQMSAPTRVRRFLSRFMVVISVALSIECLVTVFRVAHADPASLPAAASIGVAAAALLAGWGVFIRLNLEAERIEPEAMEEAKREDRQLG
jgi:hypothetical protein